MSAHKKDGKTELGAGMLPPTVKTVVGVPNLPVYPPLDLDMEELSGSLLLEEPPGRGALIAARFAPPPSSTSPFLPAASSVPPHAAVPMPKLPKPTPPPRHDVTAQPNEPRPPPVAYDALPASTPELSAANAEVAPPSPPAQPPEPVRPTRRAHTSPLVGDVEVTTLPQGRLEPILRAMKKRLRNASAMLPWGDSPRGKLAKSASPFIALAVLVAGVSLVVLVVTAIRGREAPTRPFVSPIASVSPTAPAVVATNPSTVPGPAPALAACAVVGEPHVLAPSAIVAAGIEVRAFGSDVALGFAPNDHEAMLLRLDPSSLSAVESTVTRSVQPIRRATPIPGKKGRLGLAIDVDRKGDPLQGRRTLPLDPPVQVGVADAQLAWAPLERGVQGKLWPLDGDGTVEALRGARSESNLAMVAIAFRRAGAVWVGTAERSTTLVPKGDLFRVGGLGPMVGSPAIAVNEGVVIVAWADRPPAGDAWLLRWMHFKAGEAAGEPSTFKPPPGGKGEEAMSPGLAVVPGGRFLLVWTEGSMSGHEVRALTLSADGAPVGAPLRISNGGVNAGQGQVAVTASGRGVVAFLESRANRFQVVATPIACAP